MKLLYLWSSRLAVFFQAHMRSTRDVNRYVRTHTVSFVQTSDNVP